MKNCPVGECVLSRGLSHSGRPELVPGGLCTTPGDGDPRTRWLPLIRFLYASRGALGLAQTRASPPVTPVQWLVGR